MKLEQSFEVTAAASEIETRIVAFMQRNGYQPNPASKQSYMRGSRVGSFLSFSPRKWRTNAQVTETQLSGSNWRVTLMLDINDDGQLVTQHERLYWKAELDDFQRAVQTGEIAVEGLAEQERALVSGGLKGLLIFLFTGLFVAMIVSIVIVKLNSHLGGWAIIAGAFTGALAGLLAAKRHWGF